MDVDPLASTGRDKPGFCIEDLRVDSFVRGIVPGLAVLRITFAR